MPYNSDGKKKIKALLKEIEALPGWRLRQMGKHITIFPPDRGQIITVPTTPSDPRWAKNMRADLRRQGYTGTALD